MTICTLAAEHIAPAGRSPTRSSRASASASPPTSIPTATDSAAKRPGAPAAGPRRRRGDHQSDADARRASLPLRTTCPASTGPREAVKELRRADLILVLDISDLGPARHARRDRARSRRAGGLHRSSRERRGRCPPGPRYVDPEAAATGELVFELAAANGWPLTGAAARALYVAILTDTGGFRFSNTRPRMLRVAADLLETGRRSRADLSRGLCQRARGPARGCSPRRCRPWWWSPRSAWPGSPCRRAPSSGWASPPTISTASSSFPAPSRGSGWRSCSAKSRQGRIKVSLRSVGDVDVAAFARPFGGGGHTKAAGLVAPWLAGRGPGDGPGRGAGLS